MTILPIDTKQKRLGILGDDELSAIYGRPHFTHEERCNYFSLSHPEKELLQVLRSIRSQAYFVLQLGYFKAKHRFFTFDIFEAIEDLQYILSMHFENSIITDFNSIKKPARLKQQQMILELFNYHICNAKIRQQLEIKTRTAATVCSKPIFIFREIMDYLLEQHIIVPGYTYMQETVGKSITHEQNRLIEIMQNNLKQSDKEELNQLLNDSSGDRKSVV